MKKTINDNNIAFIDAQNLHLGTASENWKIDFNKFRVYLKDKFNVNEAYYFLGFLSEDEEDLYSKLQKAGFIVVFREHSSHLKGKKKGNVDVDIVFDVMKRINSKSRDFDKIILVSGDGDYIKLVKHLIEKQLLKKILFPNKQYSSLYDKIRKTYGMNLGVKEIKNKIGYKGPTKEEKEIKKQELEKNILKKQAAKKPTQRRRIPKKQTQKKEVS